jgi:hypothetical protein
MYKAACAALVLAIGVAVSISSGSNVASAATPKPKASKLPYPTIVHVVSRPLCLALRSHVGPIVGALIANDATIAKGQPLFADYNKYNGSQAQAHEDITLLRMENLIGPLVKNFDAIDKLLNDKSVFHYPPRDNDDVRLWKMRDQLQTVVDDQKASLDVISGFVATTQLAQMQHEGIDEAAKTINAPDPGSTPSGIPTVNPAFANPENAGLPQDPHQIDLANIPGLTLGANPTTRLADGLKWTRDQAQVHEAPASQTILANVQDCRPPAASPSPAPSPTPTP